MKIILGLGNPGKRYERTRHNLGFLVVDRFASIKKVTIQTQKYSSLLGEWQQHEEKVLLVKPLTYMNRSGDTVRAISQYHSVSVSDLIVVHDDLDLPFGRIRIRSRGGHGGHRGVFSVLETLGDEGFMRVRVGIGRPPTGEDPIQFVLEPFPAEQQADLDRAISKAADALDTLLQEGCGRAMEKFNRLANYST